MIAAKYLLGLVVAVLIAAVGELVSDEIRARLDRIPLALLAAASRRIAPEFRTELYDEAWLPELQHILQGDEAMPITRLIHGTRYAVRLWLSAPHISRVCTGTARQSLLSRAFTPSIGLVLYAGPLPIVVFAACFAVENGSWIYGLVAVLLAGEGYVAVRGARWLLMHYLGYRPNAASWCPCRWATLSRAIVLPSTLTATCAAVLLNLVNQNNLLIEASLFWLYLAGSVGYFYLLWSGYSYRVIYMVKSLQRRDMSDTASPA